MSLFPVVAPRQKAIGKRSLHGGKGSFCMRSPGFDSRLSLDSMDLVQRATQIIDVIAERHQDVSRQQEGLRHGAGGRLSL